MYGHTLWRLPGVLTMVAIVVPLARLLVVSAVIGSPTLAVIALIMAALGLPLLWLASMEEANLWREGGVWISLFAYAGTLVGAQMDMVGMGDFLYFFGVALGLVALLYTAIAFALTVQEDPADDPDERQREARRGLELGAAMGAGILVALGLVPILASTWDFANGGRVAAVVAVVAVATTALVRGAYVHATARAERLGLALLWIGAIGLTLVSVLDTIPMTTISGPSPSDWDVVVSGIAFLFLPGAALGLLAAMAGTKRSAHRHDGQLGSLTPTTHRL